MSKNWSAPTDFETVCRRASGRRRYNSWRHFMREYRRAQVARLLLEFIKAGRGTSPLGIHGEQAAIARQLGVSRSTISRDVQAIHRRFHPCPHCGKPVPPYSWQLVDLSGEPIAPAGDAEPPTSEAVSLDELLR